MVSKYTGQKAHVFIDSGNNEVITTGSTIAGQKYFIMDRGDGSSVPLPAGMIFQASRVGPQLTLVEGDRLYHIDEERFCKTSASFELGQDAVDVGDDCRLDYRERHYHIFRLVIRFVQVRPGNRRVREHHPGYLEQVHDGGA